MKYFDKYGFGEERNIHIVKKLVEQAVSIELEHNISSHIYSLDIPEIGFDIFKLRYNKICDEDGWFLQYDKFPEHVIILLTWGDSLETVDWYRDRLVDRAKANFLTRTLI
jgi:hypothetical protein